MKVSYNQVLKLKDCGLNQQHVLLDNNETFTFLSSWTLFGEDYKNLQQSSLTPQCFESISNTLNPNIVFLGLNPGKINVIKDPYKAFHETPRINKSGVIEYAKTLSEKNFEKYFTEYGLDTFQGSYITDIIKFSGFSSNSTPVIFNQGDSTKITNLSENILDYNFEVLLNELEILLDSSNLNAVSKEINLIPLGGTSLEYTKKFASWSQGKTLIKINILFEDKALTHYSQRVKVEYQKKGVESFINKFNARFGV